MQVIFPISLLALLVHVAIFLTSDRPDRRRRLAAGLAVLLLTWPLWYAGMTLDPGDMFWKAYLVALMAAAPYYLPLFSFTVYLRRKRSARR